MQEESHQQGFGHDFDPGQLAALRQGDPAALAAAYDRYARAAYGLALRVLADPEDAADVVQDVFLRLPRAARCFRGEAPFGAWLRRLVANATIDRLRERRRLLPLEEAQAEVAGEMRAADLAEAHALLQKLSPTARLVLLLHAVEGYTHAELAALFRQSESYSKSILSRALKRLRGSVGYTTPVGPP